MQKPNFKKKIDIYIQKNYIRQCSTYLPRFKHKGKHSGNDLWNFRCVECGDSKTDKTKCRGFIHWFDKEKTFFYSCRKCGFALPFTDWLKLRHPNLYKDMIYEVLAEERQSKRDEKPKKTETKIESSLPDFTQYQKSENDSKTNVVSDNIDQDFSGLPNFEDFNSTEEPKKVDYDSMLEPEVYIPLKGLDFDIFKKDCQKISDLPDTHPAKRYCVWRKIPESTFNRLYFVKEFQKWCNTWKPNSFSKFSLKHDEPRLILPFFNTEGKVFAVQGRSFKNGENVLRYITIKQHENDPKIYGLESIDNSENVFVIEGPIDSLFIENSVAMAGSDASILDQYINKPIKVFDNEPRKITTCKKIKKEIDAGNPVVIWPNNITHNDINDMIMYGKISIEQLNQILIDNTYQGMVASLKFNEWCKCSLNQKNNKPNKRGNVKDRFESFINNRH